MNEEWVKEAWQRRRSKNPCRFQLPRFDLVTKQVSIHSSMNLVIYLAQTLQLASLPTPPTWQMGWSEFSISREMPADHGIHN